MFLNLEPTAPLGDEVGPPQLRPERVWQTSRRSARAFCDPFGARCAERADD